MKKLLIIYLKIICINNMYNPGDTVEITASNEMIKEMGADLQIKTGQKAKVIKTFPDGWIVLQGEYLGMPCEVDVPSNFVKKA